MIGGILVKLAFASALLACGSYYVASTRRDLRVLNAARYAYTGAAIMVLGFCSTLLYLILTHQFQYTYVWNYSSTDLPTPLLVSTFYAGQEGSFSLWALYTTIIGVALLQYSAKRNYEAEVMFVWSLILSALLLMLIVKNPFELIWDTFPKDLLRSGVVPSDVTNFAWVDQAKGIWAQFPVEGKGLNPLLQNYWMVIHPQILFTGFTSMAVPYTFALAGLLRRDYQSWVKVAKPWTVFGAAALGTGIILGGYWAYETLGWGGYWGWDPVENSSLIPWLVCVSSVHTMMSQRRSGTFVRTNFVLSILCFIMVLYSTFLTRSGVLGETSVHSFVSPGMWAYWILLGFIILFAGLGFGLLLKRMKEMPKIPVEHTIYSREFALFLGAFAIVLCAVFITIGTSAPIITNILKGKSAAVDTAFYLKTTLPLGIVIALLAGIGQLLWWKNSSAAGLLKSMLYPLVTTVLFTAGLVAFGMHDVAMIIFSFAAAFALFVNLAVGYRVFVGNPRFAGGAIAHIGLALLFLGFVSSARYDDKQTVSLPQGKSTEILNGYTLTYLGNRPLDEERFGFDVQVQHGKETYMVVPTMHISSKDNTMMRHPDILNMYTKDFYITPLSVETPEGNPGQTLEMLKGETKELADGVKVTFLDFDFDDMQKGSMLEGGAFSIGVDLRIAKEGKTEDIKAVMKNARGEISYIPATSGLSPFQFTIKKMQPNREDPSKSRVEITALDPAVAAAPRVETLVVEASIKPYINLVWMGTVTLVVGFILTIIRRVQEARGESEPEAAHAEA
jgi:cytochrome c-type biogenesis protein CcmF